jgi:hypothetical protein
MSFGGGSSTTTQELPQWLEDAARQNLERAQYTSRIGYVPYYGNDVAGFTPMQQSAMQNSADAASAFGLSAPSNAMSGLPPMTTDAAGFTGYSSGNLYDNAMQELAQRRPAQYSAMNAMFIDPVSGDLGVAFNPGGGVTVNENAQISTPASSQGMNNNNQYDVSNVAGNQYMIDSNGYLVAADPFAAGNYNIAGTSSDGGMDYVGNTMGYEGNPWVQAGYGLSNINPVISPVGSLLGGLIGEQMIGYDTQNIAGADTITTNGSFDQGEFTDSTPTDITGGAMGSNVATNAAGDAVSVGYGYGQVDPSIAAAAGYTVDPTYNPTPSSTTVNNTDFYSPAATGLMDQGVDPGIANTVARTDNGSTTTATNPATGTTTTTYYDNSGNSTGSYTSGQGLTLTDRNDDGSYNVPSQVTSSSSSSSSGGGGGGGGTYCCTAMRKNGDWKEHIKVYRMHKWHFEQPQWWRDGYDTWGKILADNLLKEKGNVWSKIMDAFYDRHVKKGKITVKSVVADIMVYPAVFAIGMAKKLTGKHVELVEVGE